MCPCCWGRLGIRRIGGVEGVGGVDEGRDEGKGEWNGMGGWRGGVIKGCGYKHIKILTACRFSSLEYVLPSCLRGTAGTCSLLCYDGTSRWTDSARCDGVLWKTDV
jgi:hypothetical protein